MKETKRNNSLYDSDTIVDNNFDLSLSQYECGYYKCFIPSKSNQGIGCLVKLLSKSDFSQTMPEMFGDLPNGLHQKFYNDKPFIIQLNEIVTRELFELYGLLTCTENVCKSSCTLASCTMIFVFSNSRFTDPSRKHIQY